jgi:predicted  nucleic acid-binding Zn-ribbon protein
MRHSTTRQGRLAESLSATQHKIDIRQNRLQDDLSMINAISKQYGIDPSNISEAYDRINDNKKRGRAMALVADVKDVQKEIEELLLKKKNINQQIKDTETRIKSEEKRLAKLDTFNRWRDIGQAVEQALGTELTSNDDIKAFTSLLSVPNNKKVFLDHITKVR